MHMSSVVKKKEIFGRNEGETNAKPRVLAVMGTLTDAPASNETRLRAAGAEEDGVNARSEPELSGWCSGKAAEDTPLCLCPSVCFSS